MWAAITKKTFIYIEFDDALVRVRMLNQLTLQILYEQFPREMARDFTL